MNIDVASLKIIKTIVETKSYSEAAKLLKMSQPAISQKVRKIENEFGLKLFQRHGRGIVPTPQAQELVKKSEPIFDLIEELYSSIAGEKAELKGVVRYGMPETCQWTPHFKKIMHDMAHFRELDFDVRIAPSEIVKELLGRGEIDFGFLVGERSDSSYRYELFSNEHYVITASTTEMLRSLDKDKSISLVAYPGYDLFFNTWLRGHPSLKKLNFHKKVILGSMIGAIHAVEAGAGLSVFPHHCILQSLENKNLHLWKNDRRPSNPIYLCRRVGESLPKRVEAVINQLRIAKKELG